MAHASSKLKRAWEYTRGWVILAAVVGGIFALIQFVALRPAAVVVETMVVERGPVERLVANTRAGSVRSRLHASLTTDAAGRVLAIRYREGASVSAAEEGAPVELIVLDGSVAQAAVAVAQWELTNAEKRAAEIAVLVDEADLEYQRLLRLHEQDSSAVAEALLDHARSALDLQRAAHDTAGVTIELARARLERAGVEAAKFVVYAPFAGVVGDRFIEVGEWAAPGMPLLTLFDPEKLYVHAELDEVDVGELREGLNVRIKLDAYRGESFAGRITRVARTISERRDEDRTITVEAEFTADGLRDGVVLRPGMSADVEIILERSAPDALRIPTMAIQTGNRVLILEGEYAREVTITPGLRNWEFTEVRDGLPAEAVVITSLDRAEVVDGAWVTTDAAADEP